MYLTVSWAVFGEFISQFHGGRGHFKGARHIASILLIVADYPVSPVLAVAQRPRRIERYASGVIIAVLRRDIGAGLEERRLGNEVHRAPGRARGCKNRVRSHHQLGTVDQHRIYVGVGARAAWLQILRKTIDQPAAQAFEAPKVHAVADPARARAAARTHAGKIGHVIQHRRSAQILEQGGRDDIDRQRRVENAAGDARKGGGLLRAILADPRALNREFRQHDRLFSGSFRGRSRSGRGWCHLTVTGDGKAQDEAG